MAKYLILYRAPQSAAEQMANNDPQAAAAGMQAWMDWAGRAGDAIVDMGSPVQPTASSDGDPVGGFSIMQAATLDDLNKALEGHPHTGMGGTIETLEFLDMPGMS